jgi:hypothetical protein
MMFVMALDMLFMAGDSDKFVKRVGGFLGLDNPIFPADSDLKRQPNITARDVLDDLYDLRNVVAHGHEIPVKPFREPKEIISTAGELIPYGRTCFYADILLEAGLFILTATLRHIFTNGLIDDVKDVSRWRGKLTLYEHRYKDQGGSAPRKQGVR